MSGQSEAEESAEATGLSGDGWRIIAASVQGPAHLARNRPREDAFAIQVAASHAIAVICDGAGSASLARAGAEGFSKSVLEALVAVATRREGFSEHEFRQAVVHGVEERRRLILDDGQQLEDHHATLIAVVAAADRTMIAHVGDGLAGVAPEGDWETAELSRPHNGEFSNETFFVTEEGWQERLRCSQVPGLQPNGAAVVLTDGAMPFVVGKDQVGLEPDFMRPVSRFLASEAVEAAAQALAGTLGSPDARRISSDDKTLVWIARGTDR